MTAVAVIMLFLLCAECVNATPGSGQVGWQGESGCASCAGSDASYSVSAEFSVDLGKRADGLPAGVIYLSEGVASSALYKPETLSYSRDRDPVSDIEVVKEPTLLKLLYQIVAPQTFVNIQTITPDVKFEIQFYLPTAKGTWNAGTQRYNIVNGSANLITTWTLENPSPGSSSSQLRITETRGGASRQWTYVYGYDQPTASTTWTLTLPSNLGSHQYAAAYDAVAQTRASSLRVFRSDGVLVYQESKVDQSYEWGWATTQETIGSGSEARTVQKTYDPTSPPGRLITGNLAPLTDVVAPDGTWSKFFYDSLGRVTQEYSGWGGQAPTTDQGLCRVILNDYSTADSSMDDGAHFIDRPRTVEEMVKGTSVSKTVHLYRQGANDPNRLVEHHEIHLSSATALASSDPDRLRTIQYFAEASGGQSGAEVGELYKIAYPNSTCELINYARDAQTGLRTITRLTGAPDSSTGSIGVASGVQEIRQVGPLGELRSVVKKRISSSTVGPTFHQVTLSQFDSFNRPGMATYLNGRPELFGYDCCGLSSQTDMDGVVTIIGYDDLKRPVSTQRLGVTRVFVLDPAGHKVVETRSGAGQSPQITQWQYDTAGLLIRHTNALNGVTSISRALNAGQLETTIAPPGGGVRVEKRDRAGLLSRSTGSAAFPVQHDYDVESAAGPESGKLFVKETKLDGSGNLTGEWLKSYRDFLGRPYKTVFAKTSYQNSNPYRQVFFNKKGQLVK
ncbi:MAG: hypothetical protein HYR88_07220, partial [Verrucomicrobia bacterium]|nr:hypothetical protein [Verrucomicrobiota bacterium]